VVVDPDDPDRRERDGVGGEVRPLPAQLVREADARPDAGDVEVEDEQRDGDRQNAVGERLVVTAVPSRVQPPLL
jgi:hypothetical protein